MWWPDFACVMAKLTNVMLNRQNFKRLPNNACSFGWGFILTSLARYNLGAACEGQFWISWAWSPYWVATIAWYVCNDVPKRILKLSTHWLQVFLLKDQYLWSLQRYGDQTISGKLKKHVHKQMLEILAILTTYRWRTNPADFFPKMFFRPLYGALGL